MLSSVIKSSYSFLHIADFRLLSICLNYISLIYKLGASVKPGRSRGIRENWKILVLCAEYLKSSDRLVLAGYVLGRLRPCLGIQSIYLEEPTPFPRSQPLMPTVQPGLGQGTYSPPAARE